MAGDDGRQIEIAFQLSARGNEVARFLHGGQRGAQSLAVERSVLLVVQPLRDQSQGGGELGTCGKIGAVVGQFKTVADLLIGLRGDLFHRLRMHRPRRHPAGVRNDICR